MADTIIIRSGVLALVAGVKAFFTANNVTAEVHAGWKQRARQDTEGPGGANRVVFTPSDDQGKGGKLTEPKFVGGRDMATAPNAPRSATARAIAEWERFLLVSVWAYDGTAPDDEEKQIEAVETLLEWTMRAVNAACFELPSHIPQAGTFGNVSWGDVVWTPPLQRSYGLELRAPLTLSHPIFDTPRDVVYPGKTVQRGTMTR